MGETVQRPPSMRFGAAVLVRRGERNPAFRCRSSTDTFRGRIEILDYGLRRGMNARSHWGTVNTLTVRRLWMAGGGLVAGMIGLILVVNAVGRDAEGVYDTVLVMIESLGLKGDTGFRFQGLIGTVLLVGGLSVTVWAATRLANDSRVI